MISRGSGLLNWVGANKELFLISTIATTVLSALLYMSNRICSSVLPRVPAIALQVVLLHFIFKYVARTIVFPGSTMQWRRTLEDSYASALLQELRRVISMLRTGYSEKSITILDTVIRSLRNQSDNEGLDASQAGLLACLEEMSAHFRRSPSARVKDTFDAQAVIAHDLIAADLIPKKRSWFTYGPARLLGSLNYQRAELRTRADARTFLVDGRIDCVVVSAISTNPMEQPSRDETGNTKLILFCNPNAGYYETCLQQGDWIQIYTDQGYDFCSWNYRGFGRSKGTPSIQTVQSDAESVFRKLRSMGYNKFGLHGRSIGGAPAVALAAKFGSFDATLDFIVADRTFSSLAVTAEALLGRFARLALWFSGESGNDLSPMWLQIPPGTRKYLLADKRDEMIADLASLKTGVAVEMARRSFQVLNPDELRVMNSLPSSASPASIAESLSVVIGHAKSEKYLSFLRRIDENAAKAASEVADPLSRIFGWTQFSIEAALANAAAWGLSKSEEVELNEARNRLTVWSERIPDSSPNVDRQSLLVQGQEKIALSISRISDTLQKMLEGARKKEFPAEARKQRGELLWVRCGHNGPLCDQEEKLFVSMVFPS